jgi:hypothetical protein
MISSCPSLQQRRPPLKRQPKRRVTTSDTSPITRCMAVAATGAIAFLLSAILPDAEPEPKPALPRTSPISRDLRRSPGQPRSKPEPQATLSCSLRRAYPFVAG